MKDLARWKVEEEYFGLFDDTQIICFTQSIDNAVAVIEAFRKAKSGRPFRYKATKIAEDYNEIYDLMDTWTENEVTGEFEESSWFEYTEGVYTYDRTTEHTESK